MESRFEKGKEKKDMEVKKKGGGILDGKEEQL